MHSPMAQDKISLFSPSALKSQRRGSPSLFYKARLDHKTIGRGSLSSSAICGIANRRSLRTRFMHIRHMVIVGLRRRSTPSSSSAMTAARLRPQQPRNTCHLRPAIGAWYTSNWAPSNLSWGSAAARGTATTALFADSYTKRWWMITTGTVITAVALRF